jgi:hypothetical protein
MVTITILPIFNNFLDSWVIYSKIFLIFAVNLISTTDFGIETERVHLKEAFGIKTGISVHLLPNESSVKADGNNNNFVIKGLAKKIMPYKGC